MANRIAQPRTRLLNFRLTEEEYLKIRQDSVACGSRGVSEYARVAVLDNPRHLNLTEPVPSSSEPFVKWLDDRFNTLETGVSRVLELLGQHPAERSRTSENGDLPRTKE